jgi:hypothetical protein
VPNVSSVVSAMRRPSPPPHTHTLAPVIKTLHKRTGKRESVYTRVQLARYAPTQTVDLLLVQTAVHVMQLAYPSLPSPPRGCGEISCRHP